MNRASFYRGLEAVSIVMRRPVHGVAALACDASAGGIGAGNAMQVTGSQFISADRCQHRNKPPHDSSHSSENPYATHH